jgi:hypothetical protein
MPQISAQRRQIQLIKYARMYEVRRIIIIMLTNKGFCFGCLIEEFIPPDLPLL